MKSVALQDRFMNMLNYILQCSHHRDMGLLWVFYTLLYENNTKQHDFNIFGKWREGATFFMPWEKRKVYNLNKIVIWGPQKGLIHAMKTTGPHPQVEIEILYWYLHLHIDYLLLFRVNYYNCLLLNWCTRDIFFCTSLQRSSVKSVRCSVHKSGSVWFFAPKTGNRRPQPV